MSNLEKIVDDLSKLTVVEAAELAKKLEEKWGVSAAAAVAVAAPSAAPAEEASAAKTEFDVHLVSVDASKKLNVIKEIRTLTDLGLKEAKDLVDGAPKVVKSGVSKDDADKAKKVLTEAGAVVEIK